MTVTVSTAALSNSELRKSVPSIFTKQPSPERSERYICLPTIEVVERLRAGGFLPVQAFESRIHRNVEARKPFAKHLIRFREQKYIDADLKPSALIPDIILTNSHNGTSSFQLEAGLYRLVCSNGMVVKSEGFGAMRVPHSGKIAEKVAEGAASMIKYVPEIMRVTKEWDKITLTPRQRSNFAKKALELRFPISFHESPPITAAQALEPRRNEDEAPTLWRTFNVLQENLINGGITGKSPTGRKVTTKLVTSVNNSLHYNRGLWELAEAFAGRA